MTNPFEGKAVRFDTSEQLDHLKELANAKDLRLGNNGYIKDGFFRYSDVLNVYDTFSITRGTESIIHYSDFVASIEAVKSNHSEQHLDMVNHPKHYNVNGFEVIDIIDAFGLNFNMGNALKYLLRADRKGNKVQDIEKAIWYLQRENKTK